MNLLKNEKIKTKRKRRTLKQKLADDIEISVKNYENKDNVGRSIDNEKFIFFGFLFLIIIIALSFLFIF